MGDGAAEGMTKLTEASSRFGVLAYFDQFSAYVILNYRVVFLLRVLIVVVVVFFLIFLLLICLTHATAINTRRQEPPEWVSLETFLHRR